MPLRPSSLWFTVPSLVEAASIERQGSDPVRRGWSAYRPLMLAVYGRSIRRNKPGRANRKGRRRVGRGLRAVIVLSALDAFKYRALGKVPGRPIDVLVVRALVHAAGEVPTMLLTLTTTHRQATDLGYLLHKRPDRFQSYDLSFGKAHVFYTEANDDRCSACLLLDVDPVGIVRGKGSSEGLLSQYVNDRPYVASSFLSVAIAQVYGSALQGRCNDRPELATTPIPLSAQIDVLPVRGGETFFRGVFEPLGYVVEARRHALDERFPEWGESPYFSVSIHKTTTLSELLTHLYVLVPVFDNQKHYFVGDDEMEKLLDKGKGWLGQHPEKEEITRRYLKFQPSLFRQALSRLIEEEQPAEAQAEGDERPADRAEDVLEKPLSLNEQRLGAVMAAIRGSGAKRVLDLGCGEGKLLRELLKDKQFEEIVGMDVSIRSLETARDRLKMDRMSDTQAARLKLIHGSLDLTVTGGWRGSTPPPWSRWSSTSTRPGWRPSSERSSSSPGRGRSC